MGYSEFLYGREEKQSCRSSVRPHPVCCRPVTFDAKVGTALRSKDGSRRQVAHLVHTVILVALHQAPG